MTIGNSWTLCLKLTLWSLCLKVGKCLEKKDRTGTLKMTVRTLIAQIVLIRSFLPHNLPQNWDPRIAFPPGKKTKNWNPRLAHARRARPKLDHGERPRWFAIT